VVTLEFTMLCTPDQPTHEMNHIETETGGVAIEKRTRKRRLLEWLAISAVLRIFTMTLYLGYRIRCMFPGSNASNTIDIAAAWLFFAIESLFAGKLITSPTHTPQSILIAPSY